jgi:solute carrier family 35 protein C2
MTSSEFALLKRTSVVTLSICGIFKEVVTIGTANLVFDDPLTPVNISGLVVTIGSIAAYNYMKIKKMREEARMNAHLQNQEEYAPVNMVDPDRDRRGSIAQAPTGTRSIVRSSLQVSIALQEQVRLRGRRTWTSQRKTVPAFSGLVASVRWI